MRTALLLLSFSVLALILSGCGASHVLIGTPLSARFIPNTASGGSGIVPVESGGFVVCLLDDDANLSMRKFNDDHTVAWETVVSDTARDIPFGADPRIRLHHVYKLVDSKEIILTLVAKGDRIILLSHRDDPEDPNQVHGRIVNATTGELIATSVVFSSKHDYNGDDVDPLLEDDEILSYRQCRVEVSPDTSRFLIYTFSPLPTGHDVEYVVLDSVLKSTRSGESTRDTAASPSTTNAEIDNAGNVYVVRTMGNNGDRYFQLESLRADGTTSLKETERLSIASFGPARLVLDSQRMNVFAAIYDDGDLLGMAVARFPLGAEAPSIARMDISPQEIERITDDDELDNANLHEIVPTSGATRYIAIFESTDSEGGIVTGNWQTDSRRSTPNPERMSSGPRIFDGRMGSLLMLGLDADGRRSWIGGFERSAPMDGKKAESSDLFGLSRASISADGRLRLVYRDEEDIAIRYFQTSDGVEVGRDVIYPWSGSSPFMRSTAWVSDKKVAILASYGYFRSAVVMSVRSY